MPTAALKDVTLFLNETEDGDGDEPVVVLALTTVVPTANNSPNAVTVAMFDSGILGDDVTSRSTPLVVPIEPPGPTQRNDAVFKPFETNINHLNSDLFMIWVQAWDDDESSVTKRTQNRKALSTAVVASMRNRQAFSAQASQIRTAVSRTRVGSDDLIGQAGQQFQYNNGSPESFSIELSGEDGNARYTLNGSVVWGPL